MNALVRDDYDRQFAKQLQSRIKTAHQTSRGERDSLEKTRSTSSQARDGLNQQSSYRQYGSSASSLLHSYRRGSIIVRPPSMNKINQMFQNKRPKDAGLFKEMTASEEESDEEKQDAEKPSDSASPLTGKACKSKNRPVTRMSTFTSSVASFLNLGAPDAQQQYLSAKLNQNSTSQVGSQRRAAEAPSRTFRSKYTGLVNRAREHSRIQSQLMIVDQQKNATTGQTMSDIGYLSSSMNHDLDSSQVGSSQFALQSELQTEDNRMTGKGYSRPNKTEASIERPQSMGSFDIADPYRQKATTAVREPKMEFPKDFNMDLYQEYLELINHGTLKQNKKKPRDVTYDYDKATNILQSKSRSLSKKRQRARSRSNQVRARSSPRQQTLLGNLHSYGSLDTLDKAGGAILVKETYGIDTAGQTSDGASSINLLQVGSSSSVSQSQVASSINELQNKSNKETKSKSSTLQEKLINLKKKQMKTKFRQDKYKVLIGKHMSGILRPNSQQSG